MKHQYGTVYAEATLKVRVKFNTYLHDAEEYEYVMDAMYNGDFDFIETPKVDSFKIEDVRTFEEKEL